MSFISALQAELPAIQAIPLDGIKRPAMPVKQYIYEAEYLHNWAQPDLAQLLEMGMNGALLASIMSRADALREATSQWNNVRFSREDAQQQWEEQSPAAYALRDKLLRDMRFVFRAEPALLKRVSDIADGTGHVDMLQDLNDLATLGRNHLDVLAPVKVDAALLDHAAALADQLTTLLAQAAGERSEGNSARLLRDRAYTHLKAAVDHVREYGQYVFWDNPTRREGYASSYVRNSNTRHAAKRAAPESPAPAAEPATSE